MPLAPPVLFQRGSTMARPVTRLILLCFAGISMLSPQAVAIEGTILNAHAEARRFGRLLAGWKMACHCRPRQHRKALERRHAQARCHAHRPRAARLRGGVLAPTAGSSLRLAATKPRDYGSSCQPGRPFAPNSSPRSAAIASPSSPAPLSPPTGKRSPWVATWAKSCFGTLPPAAKSGACRVTSTTFIRLRFRRRRACSPRPVKTPPCDCGNLPRRPARRACDAQGRSSARRGLCRCLFAEGRPARDRPSRRRG